MAYKHFLLAATMVISGSAHAALIDGSLSMSGGFAPVDSLNNPTTLGAATGIDFTGIAHVEQAEGDYAGALGDAVTMTDFQFSPNLDPNPVNVWSVDGFTFAMDQLSTVFQNTNFLLLSGAGTVSGNGFDATEGTWWLSAQTAQNITFSWSATSATVVPVPAAAWLFGSGLLGLVGIARKKSA